MSLWMVPFVINQRPLNIHLSAFDWNRCIFAIFVFHAQAHNWSHMSTLVLIRFFMLSSWEPCPINQHKKDCGAVCYIIVLPHMGDRRGRTVRSSAYSVVYYSLVILISNLILSYLLFKILYLEKKWHFSAIYRRRFVLNLYVTFIRSY